MTEIEDGLWKVEVEAGTVFGLDQTGCCTKKKATVEVSIESADTVQGYIDSAPGSVIEGWNAEINVYQVAVAIGSLTTENGGSLTKLEVAEYGF